MEKQKPGIKRACEYLSALKQEQGFSHLPSIRALSKSAGVSFVTMWKAVKYMQENGFLCSSSRASQMFPGSDYTTINLTGDGQTTSSSALEEPNLSRHYVAEKLYRDIVTGRFSNNDRLPSCKELQRLYDVSFATLKKALGVLVKQQIIEPRTNGYFIPSINGNTGHARIVAIGCGWEDGKIWLDHQDKSYFRIIESECIRMNIQLDLIVYYRDQGRLRFVHTASKKDYDLSDRTILGYIFIVANLDSTPEEVLERLVGLQRSVAVLDVVGGWKIPRCAKGSRMVQFFTVTASELPAKRVAQYLLRKGHKKIAFFSPFHRALWSQQRLNIISEMYSLAGISDKVISFVYDNYAYKWDYLKKQGYQEDFNSLINQYNEWKKEAHGAFIKKVGNFGYSIVKYLTESNCASEEIYEKMKPLFDKALEDRSISAWVMANDFAATIAIDYLKERNIRVPEDLSIVSFDNSMDAMEYQLTSYEFNSQGIIALILRYILAPHTIKSGRKGGCIEVDGTLVVRRSG